MYGITQRIFSARGILRLLTLQVFSTLVAGIVLATEAQEVELAKTPGGVSYGLWKKTDQKPAPTLFVLAGTIDQTLGSSYFRQCGNELAEQGYFLVSIDLPCHGTQTGEGKPSGLGGWATRAEKGENFVAECNKRLSGVLDHLVATGVADPNQIAICGTSRGGFLAIHFAAHDARVRCAAAFAPVTDLAALSEFKGKENAPTTKQLSLASQAGKLAGRPVWIVIGDQDERVGTQNAIGLTKLITEEAKIQKVESRAKLLVMPEPRGHTTPKGSPALAARWILEEIK